MRYTEKDCYPALYVIVAAVIVRYGASEIGEVVGGLYGLRADDRLLRYGQPRAEGLQHSL